MTSPQPLLSILIPTRDGDCYALVSELRSMAEQLGGAGYEILVADDGSRDQAAIASNLRIDTLPNCRYIQRRENIGRAGTRNFLADQAQGEWLLFLDCDVRIISDDFLSRYLNHATADAVSGRTKMLPCADKHNLRRRYELAWLRRHTPERLNKTPHEKFLTTNFLCRRAVFTTCRFDERYRTYGFEDVAFGVSLERHGFTVRHIDNPVGIDRFDDNERYLRKTEESLRTLHRFRNELRGHSGILALTDRLAHLRLLWLLRLWHNTFGGAERRSLVRRRPPLFLLNLYKAGYFAAIR